MDKTKFLKNFERAEGSPCLDYKEISLRISQLGFELDASNLENCNQNLVGWTFCNCGPKPVYRTCKLSICPHCRKIRAYKIFNRFHQKLQSYRIARSIFDPGLRFLTLTIKSNSDLKASDAFIRQAFHKFKMMSYVKERITSGFYVIEHKKTDENLWHVHIHAIIFSKYMDIRNVKLGKKSKLLASWNKAVGYESNIDIRRITSHKGALNYVLGYLTKSNFKTEQDVVEYYFKLANKRMFATFGKRGELYCLGHFHVKICNKCGVPYTFEPLSIFYYDFESNQKKLQPECC